MGSDDLTQSPVWTGPGTEVGSSSKFSKMAAAWPSLGCWVGNTLVASFTKEVKPRLAKPPLKINGCLANRWLTSLVKEATENLSVSAVTVKTFGLLPDRAWIWLDFPDFKHDYIKEVYRSDLCFASHGLRTGDFHGDCFWYMSNIS